MLFHSSFLPWFYPYSLFVFAHLLLDLIVYYIVSISICVLTFHSGYVLSSLVLIVPHPNALIQGAGGNDGLPHAHVHPSDAPAME